MANTTTFGSNDTSKWWQSSALAGVGATLGGISGQNAPSEDIAVREGIRAGIASIPIYGPIISAATSIVDTAGELSGLNLENIDLSAAKRAGVHGGAMANKIANIFPGNSMAWGWMGADTHKAYRSADAMSLGSSYGGAMQTLNDAQALSDKRMLFGRRKANRFIDSANKLNEQLTAMSREQTKRANNVSGQITLAQNQNIYSGRTPGLSLKKGGTIPELEEVRAIMQSLQSKKQEVQEPKKFQLGGKMNMIVTGALHARKHNLEELNPNLEGEITKKGIPVIAMSKVGKIQSQQAEIEREELILQIDTTKTIEDYYDEYNSTDSKTEKNKIALACGKYLVDELLKNTDDPDKLIKKTV